MQLFNHTIRPDTNLFLFGDDHEGVSSRYAKGWDKLIDMMNSPYDGCSHNIGVDHGDCIEAIMVGDKRYTDLKIRHDKILTQIENAIKNRQHIKDKLVCILTGNHELKLWREGDVSGMICKGLGVRSGDWTSIITYTDKRGKPVFKHYCCHGTRTINSIAGPRLRKEAQLKVRLQDLLKDLASDCFLMSQGDVHRLIRVAPNESLILYSEDNHLKSGYTNQEVRQLGRYLHEEARWYCATGSFLRSRVQDSITYSEMRGYPPTQLGFMIARIRNYKLVGIDEIRLQ